MSKDIYIDTGDLSSRLLKKTSAALENASEKLAVINSCPMYQSPTGYEAIFPSDVSSEIIQLQNTITTLQNKLNSYSSILNTGAEEIVEVDSSCKSELTTWMDRAGYHVDSAFTWAKTGVETTINYWVDNYKNRGWSYKVVQSAVAIGKAAPAIVGCVASWIAAPWAPTTWLSTAYAANDAYSMISDLGNIWSENYEDVGNVNFLKDTLVQSGGDLSEMICGNRDIGELVGNGIYGGGKILTTITNATNIKTQITNRINGNSQLTDPNNEMLDDLKKKFGIGLKEQITQSDVSFKTVQSAIKETPKALKGLWDIAVNSPISQVAKDYKLLTYTIPNIVDFSSAIDTLSTVADTTQFYIKNIFEIGSSLF